MAGTATLAARKTAETASMIRAKRFCFSQLRHSTW